MSEYINHTEKRIQELVNYAKGILAGERGADLYKEYKSIIEKVTPKDVIIVVDELVKTGEDISEIKRAVNKILNIFYSAVKAYGPANSPKGSFLYYLMLENSRMEDLLKLLKVDIKQVFKAKDSKAELLKYKESLISKFRQLKEYEKHYQKKENILFPYFEKAFPDYRCVNVMWSMHDDARNSLVKLIETLESDEPNINDFNFETGKYFFAVLPIIFREDYILYPECLKEIAEEDWTAMSQQSKEIGFAFIGDDEIEPLDELESGKDSGQSQNNKNLIDLDTGLLKLEQIISIFNHLPVDITFVDENDEVRYFSDPKDRFFTRSKAIIGRKVQNCHPPESIDIVNRIVESFRKGEKDVESFWIQIKEKFVLIQYFAIRNSKGEYKGVIEVSQDVSNIRKLEGERRLID